LLKLFENAAGVRFFRYSEITRIITFLVGLRLRSLETDMGGTHVPYEHSQTSREIHRSRRYSVTC